MKLKPFQREDLARLAVHSGGILSWDTGLGKTLAAYLWPLLKVGVDWSRSRPGHRLPPAGPVLIVASGDLHAQLIAEARTHLDTEPVRLPNQTAFLKLARIEAGRMRLPPGFYLTSFTELTRNGVAKPPKHPPGPVPEAQVRAYFERRGIIFAGAYATMRVKPTDTLGAAQRRWSAWNNPPADVARAWEILQVLMPETEPMTWESLRPEQQATVREWATRAWWQECLTGIGEERQRIKCVYSPTLADLAVDAFDCVVVDEGTRIKGDTSLVGLGVRRLNPPYRLILTATPIKNRLPDLFWLAHWATGGQVDAHARFPYGEADCRAFMEEFQVTERNLSAEARAKNAGSNRRYLRVTAQVSNVHRLWKLLAPVVLRRRKRDCGEQIVPRVRHVVRVPMGRHQAAVYRFHLQANYVDANGKPAIGAKLQALRIAAANPCSNLLERPASDPQASGPHRSAYGYIPKLASALAIIQQAMTRREQVIVFGAFHDSLDILARRLDQAGVPYAQCDGRVSPARRGELAAEFKRGPGVSRYGVMLAGIECMAEGHSFPLCQNVVLLAYSWAFDKYAQALDRIHRINSPKPVHVWVLICEGTIDRRLESLVAEKSDAAELVLDGRLLAEDPTEVNLAELLQAAQQDFQPGLVQDESELEKSWPALCQQLTKTWGQWRQPARRRSYAVDLWFRMTH